MAHPQEITQSRFHAGIWQNPALREAQPDLPKICGDKKHMQEMFRTLYTAKTVELRLHTKINLDFFPNLSRFKSQEWDLSCNMVKQIVDLVAEGFCGDSQ